MDPFLLIMLLLVGGMLLITNRSRKAQRQAMEFRSQLAIGDDVMTGSGLFGTVVDVDGDVITLESPSGARTDWLRAAIAKLESPPFASTQEEDAYDEEGTFEEQEAGESAPDEGAPDGPDDAAPGARTS